MYPHGYIVAAENIMKAKTRKLLDASAPSRQDRLRAWLALHGIRFGELAEQLGVHPSMITRIVKGERAPAKRIRQLLELGIPEDLLPEPSPPPGRPAKNARTPQNDDDG